MGRRWVSLVLALALLLVAGGLRFLRLGDWPFYGDELPTLQEAACFFGEATGPVASQSERLPRLIPVSYAVHQAGYALFGRDEFGSRVVLALLGMAHVLIVFLGLRLPAGRVPAFATALLLALWPEHIFRSQENRFYMTAAVWASLCMVLGAQAVYRRSATLAALASAAAFVAVLAHTLLGLLLVGLVLALAAAAWVGRSHRLVRPLAVALLGNALAAGVVLAHVLPLARGWNGREEWGFGGGHSILASVSQLGWPVALLALLGAVAAWRRRGEQDAYWLAWAGVWAAATVDLPSLVVYHPAYVFPLTLGTLVLAGQAVGLIYESLRCYRPAVAYAWLGVAALLNLPGVVSYYMDGARCDFRAAARYVKDHWQPGDRVATASPTLLKYYLADATEVEPVKGTDPLPRLRELARAPGRLWIVVPSFRRGKPEALQAWLGEHCSQRLTIRKPRLDYYENVTEVFLHTPPADTPASASGEGGNEAAGARGAPRAAASPPGTTASRSGR